MRGQAAPHLIISSKCGGRDRAHSCPARPYIRPEPLRAPIPPIPKHFTPISTVAHIVVRHNRVECRGINRPIATILHNQHLNNPPLIGCNLRVPSVFQTGHLRKPARNLLDLADRVFKRGYHTLPRNLERCQSVLKRQHSENFAHRHLSSVNAGTQSA